MIRALRGYNSSSSGMDGGHFEHGASPPDTLRTRLSWVPQGGPVWRQPKFHGRGGWAVSYKAGVLPSRSPPIQFSGGNMFVRPRNMIGGKMILRVGRTCSGIARKLRRKPAEITPELANLAEL